MLAYACSHVYFHSLYQFYRVSSNCVANRCNKIVIYSISTSHAFTHLISLFSLFLIKFFVFVLFFVPV